MRFTESHEWIKIEEDQGVVGITQHAQKELGAIVFIELPPVGTKVLAGDPVAVLESTKAAADIYSPVSGEVIAINQNLNGFTEIVNTSPEEEGWLFKIKLANVSEVESLLEHTQYLELIIPSGIRKSDLS